MKYVPTNGKTLYIRNLELILLRNNILQESDINKFRKKVVVEILSLTQNLIDDLLNESISNMYSMYVGDSVTSNEIH